MKTFILLTIVLFATCEGIKNYIGTELHECFKCMCHARTGCYSRFNCASYSINFDYWKTAKSPVLDRNDEPEDMQSYKKCMKNENCILATLDQYAEAVNHMDCNCDGRFDCKDRFALHLFGNNCANPKFKPEYVSRFNRCAQGMGMSKMQREEGNEGCVPEIF